MAMVVNETKLNAAMTATADAIRAKTGDSAQIPFDYNGGKGFADAVEAIPQGGGGDPDESLSAFLGNTITYVKIPSAVSGTSFATRSRDCLYFSLKNWNADMYIDEPFKGLAQNSKEPRRKNFVCIGKVKDTKARTFYDAKVSVLVILSTSVPRLTGDLMMEFNESIYVRDSLVESFKTASNWSRYSTYKGLSEAPVYDSSTTYGIGDVCKLDGHFYSYSKRDLTSASGQAPSGTTSDNEYWEYLAEVDS